MRNVVAAGLAAACSVVLLAGCATSGVGDGGKIASASLETSVPGPAPNPSAPSAPAPAPVVSRGAFLEGPIGSRLATGDRDAALKAEVDAVTSGERKTWRGEKGTYGFVVPAADRTAGAADSVAGGGCRGFTHTIYFAGRPQVGHGTGCREPDGSWRITG